MESIKFVSGRPQVSHAPIQRTRLEFTYPTIQEQQLQQKELKNRDLPGYPSYLPESGPPSIPSIPEKVTLPEAPVPEKIPLPDSVTPAISPSPQDSESRQFAIGCTPLIRSH